RLSSLEIAISIHCAVMLCAVLILAKYLRADVSEHCSSLVRRASLPMRGSTIAQDHWPVQNFLAIADRSRLVRRTEHSERRRARAAKRYRPIFPGEFP